MRKHEPRNRGSIDVGWRTMLLHCKFLSSCFRTAWGAGQQLHFFYTPKDRKIRSSIVISSDDVSKSSAILADRWSPKKETATTFANISWKTNNGHLKSTSSDDASVHWRKRFPALSSARHFPSTCIEGVQNIYG